MRPLTIIVVTIFILSGFFYVEVLKMSGQVAYLTGLIFSLFMFVLLASLGEFNVESRGNRIHATVASPHLLLHEN